MPKGVEHLAPSRWAFSMVATVPPPVMPKGVEHRTPRQARSDPRGLVPPPVMPKGVEHDSASEVDGEVIDESRPR